MFVTRWTRAVAVGLVALSWIVAAQPVAIAQGATRNPLTNTPAQNIPPRPNFLSSGPCRGAGGHSLSCQNPCFSGATGTIVVAPYNNSTKCTDFILGAINTARSVEHLPAMALPDNWHALTVPQQLFVITNLERTARGLPPFRGLVPRLNHSAAMGAVRNVDPWTALGMPIRTFTSILADASPSPLAADYVWMYNDGWGGSVANTSNIDCTSPNAAGCWGHRLNILGRSVGPYCHTCEMGAAYINDHGQGVYAEIFVRPANRPAATSFGWARNVVPHLVGSPHVTTTTTPT